MRVTPCFSSLAQRSPARSPSAFGPPRQLRIPPVDPFQHVSHLRRRNRHDSLLRCRQDELSPVEPLGVERQPEAVVPKDLREVAPAPPENVEIAAMRVALQLFLDLKRQSLHAATHVGVARRDPHPHPARHRDHRSLRTFRTRRSASASTALSTRTRLPELSSISITPDFARRPLAIARECLAAWDPEGVAAPISTGSKIELSLPPASGARACLRHVKSRLCATPCRRATSHTTAPGISVSSTILDFSSLLQRRRRSTPRTFPSISA